MKNEKIKEITSKAIEQLIAALNEGRSETLTSYLTAMAKFHRYSLSFKLKALTCRGQI
jgi:hypothetical protein